MSEWISVKERLPDHDIQCLMVGVRTNYCFGHRQLLAGWFIHKYYDTVINEFRPIESRGWTVTHWMPGPVLPLQPGATP